MLKKFLFTIVLLLSVGLVYAQDASTQNIATVNVDQLTDEQIQKYLTQAQALGVQIDQIEGLAVAKGMPASEAKKLVNRINKLNGQMTNSTESTASATNEPAVVRQYTPAPIEQKPEPKAKSEDKAEQKLKIFGSDLFTNQSISFEPNLRLATPPNYQLGPDDQILITLTGNSSVEWKPQVSPEGTINIPSVGFVNVNGLTIQQATSRIKTKLIRSQYAIGNGTNLTVSLGNIKSIKVTITGNGANRPGTYTLSSLSTVFNALYASGGPSENGSFRNIELIRNNKVIKKLDIYNFLTKGIQQDNITLKDQDIINIPTYTKRVEFSGQVKQPAIFEVVESDRLKDVINYAGGFTNYAYTDRIKVMQVTGKERKIADVASNQFNTYIPQRGDKYMVDSILERYANRVVIQGAVFRPGEFQLEKGLTLSQLIKKADGLKEEAFTSRGTITRLKADNTTELISFDVLAVLNAQAEDVKLQREDVVFISSIFDLKDSYKISVSGEVRSAGNYHYDEQMSLEDAILKAGGFMEGASTKRIEISRRVKKDENTANNTQIAEVFTIDIENNLSTKGANFKLQPFDIVIVRNLPGYEKQRLVKIEGEVLYPGYYTLQNRNERVSDLLKRAGGLMSFADVAGSSLKRVGILNKDSKNKIDYLTLEAEKINQKTKLLSSTKDLSQDAKQAQSTIESNIFLDINLEKIIANPNSKWDVFLEEGDILRIPKKLQTVKVSGEVLFPTLRLYDKGMGFKSYIREAGGYTQRALRRREYIIYPNGAVRSTKHFLFFTSYPRVKAGSEIIIPKAVEKKGMTTQEWLGVTTATASLATILIGILNFIK